MLTPPEVEESAAALERALRERRPIRGLGRDKLSMADAYVVQEQWVRICGRKVAGYKIGAASKASQKLIGADEPFLGRLLADTCLSSAATVSLRDYFAPGVEAEFAFHMATGLPGRSTPFNMEEVAAAVRSASPIIEICDNRFVDWRAVSVEEIVADNAFHGALVVGPEVTAWRAADLAHCEARISIDGSEVGCGISEPVIGDPLGGLVWVANKLRQRGQGLQAGDAIAVGTWTGLHFIHQPGHVVADYGHLGRVEIHFAP
jgi:2-keto-4-pentenoate hydratase